MSVSLISQMVLADDSIAIRHSAATADVTKPFTLAYDGFKGAPKGHEPFEYACHEGNQKAIFLMTGVDMDKVFAQIAAEMAKVYEGKK